jgi:uncharacterized membrane protein YeaQ/YmgE (transglycosylase-associated protein family)
MLRIILGVIAGFIAWSILWVGSDQVLMSAWPDWYGDHQHAFAAAMVNSTSFAPDSTILLMHLVRAVIISIMAGFLAAMIARENRTGPVILGILLLVFGALVQAMAWSYLPLWYHLVFLGSLIPFTVLGGRLKQTT